MEDSGMEMQESPAGMEGKVKAQAQARRTLGAPGQLWALGLSTVSALGAVARLKEGLVEGLAAGLRFKSARTGIWVDG